MTAFDELLAEFASLPGRAGQPVERLELERALVSVAIRDCKPGFIVLDGDDDAWFSLEGVLAFLVVVRKDTTPKMQRLRKLIGRAIEEMGSRDHSPPAQT